MYQLTTLHPHSTTDHWRTLAQYWKLSDKAKHRLEWMIFYETVSNHNVRATAIYFGISPKTFYKWKRRFDPHRFQSLEENSRTPHQKRSWQVTPLQEDQIKKLRIRYPKYGKCKLKVLYAQDYRETISTWKIERVIRKHHLYPDPQQHAKTLRRVQKRRSKPKLRIHDLRGAYSGTLWHTDSVILWWYGERRVIFTALEDKSRLGYARVYLSGTSKKAADFLQRLVYLTGGNIKIIHSDNGSEFAGEFEKSCKQLGIQQIYSRARQPKDNPALERFNRTLQEEWLELSEVGLDEISEANLDLTQWLIEYNNHRPHQALDYLTPLQYAETAQVLPMSPARTGF